MGALMALRAVFALAIFVFMVAALLWLGRSLAEGRRRPRATEPRPEEFPLEILRRRYAAGEIDEDEYLRRLSGLSQR